MKNVVITGASKGIGYATALAFVKEGHQVLALARNEKLLKELARQVQGSPGRLFIHTCDIRGLDVSEVTNFFPQVDVLINNAGCLVNRPFTEIGAAELQEVYEVNVFAPFRLVQKLMAVFSPQAHIVNVSSVGGVNGTQKFPGLSAYSSSKAAMSCLSECWQAEYAETDLTFNSLALGSVQTEMLAKAFPGMKAAATPTQMADYIFHFALNAPLVLKGKTHLVSSNST